MTPASPVLYQGRSLLTGDPIVAIATASENRKTGPSVQVWILRSDMNPMDASRRGADDAICGQCPQRHNLGGACYVPIYQAPRSVYAAWKRGYYARPDVMRRLHTLTRFLPIRLGAYGDPAAVPVEVWTRLLARGCGNWSGYTHQWRNPRAALHKRLLMASVESEEGAREAVAAGWRYFRVMPPGAAPLPREILCTSERAHEPLTCGECGACNGADVGRYTPQAASVRIEVHGARSGRFLTVIR